MRTLPSRRHFLAGIGASLLAAPFVRFLNSDARADSTGFAKRLVILFSPDGMIGHRWGATGSGANFQLAENSVLEPLNGLRQHLLFLDGFSFFNANNHEAGMAAMLTNLGGSGTLTGNRSLDQYVASELNVSTRFPSLELGVVSDGGWGGGTQTRMCYSGPNQYVTPDDDPAHVYDRLFGDLTDPHAEQRKTRRLRALDLALADLNQLHDRLGSEEKAKLQYHMESLYQLENAVNTVAGPCDPGDAPSIPFYKQDVNIPQVMQAQLDLLVSALACDHTRVASVQLSHTVSNMAMPWLNLSTDHHTLSHCSDGDTAGVEGFVQSERWCATQFAYLVQKLLDTPDPEGGTLLDSTLVLWAKEMGDPRLHVCSGVPFVLAGSAGGRFTTGRYLTFPGTPHARLLVTLCQALGLANETFGDPEAGSGALTELS